MIPAKKQAEILTSGCVSVIEREELLEKIETGKKLRIKFGADPSAPDIHLGHIVVLDKLRQFGELGHRIVFIIGDFTARIGDPSGRQKTRPMLSKEEVIENARTYQRQVFKILSRDYTDVVYNSEWLEKMTFEDVLKLSSNYTVSRMLERDDFKERFKKNIPIRTSEFLYPLLQGYDSVRVNADVEIGGSDQIFNLLVGRTLQQKFGKAPQVVMTLPLLVGTDGQRKMSKSYGNYISVDDSPEEIYGKAMSVSDELMLEWAEIFSFIDAEELKKLPPRNAKALLARSIVKYLHSEKDASEAEQHFEKVVVKKDIPDEIPEIAVREKTLSVVDLVVRAAFVRSRSRAKALINQNAVAIDGKPVKNFAQKIEIKDEMVLKVGKRKFVKIRRR
ncbi:MAG: tyrosine--tRNA ligase [Elusimicrobia bacterium]|nr:tyrosine--tRNA ligase [Elusimicrobiota bacterium]